MKRKSFTAKQRAEIFLFHKAECHLCKRKISPGEDWEIEHEKPKGLGGTDQITNTKPAHVDCHKPKTADDKRVMSKADRVAKKYTGAKASKQSIRSPGFQKTTKNRKPYVRGLKGDDYAERIARKHNNA
jgi:5-methylcytosine-specific restriction endonuclease McrA